MICWNKGNKRARISKWILGKKQRLLNNLAQLNQDYNKIHQQKLAIYQQAGVHDDNQFTQYLANRSVAQSQALASDAYGQQLTAEDRQALAAYANSDELMTALAKARHQLDQLNLTISHTHEEIQKGKVEIDSLVKDGTLSNLNKSGPIWLLRFGVRYRNGWGTNWRFSG